MTAPRPMLSWIVPLYRNGNFAAELIRQAHAAAADLNLSCEIVLVDDCCPEQSGEQAKEAARRQSAARVRIIKLSVNQGQDSAIRVGLRECAGNYALIIDGDLQDPPEILARLRARLEQTQTDVIFAARHGTYAAPGKLRTSRLYRWTMSWVGGLPAGAGVCALLNRKAIDAVAGTRVRRISLLAALAGARLRCASVPVLRVIRSDGSSAYSTWTRTDKALHSLLQTMRARWLRLPL